MPATSCGRLLRTGAARTRTTRRTMPRSCPAGWEALEDALTSRYEERAEELGMRGALLRVLTPQATTTITSGPVDAVYPTKILPVASATKLVTGALVLKLIDEGKMKFEDTVGEVLGGLFAEDPTLSFATIDHLGSFVGGLNTFHPAVFSTEVGTLRAACEKIVQESPRPLEVPGSTFAYAGSQTHLLALMAEERAGMGWSDLFDKYLRTPLGLSEDCVYTTQPSPSRPVVSNNPMVSGGLMASAEDFERVLRMILADGEAEDGSRYLSTDLVGRLFRNPHAGAKVASNPLEEMGLGYRYGFCCWMDAEGAPAEADVISSPGFNGFVPFLDRANGYAAVLALGSGRADGVMDAEVWPFCVHLTNELKPHIERAVRNNA